MSDEWEQHHARFEPDRVGNFDAYVDAWTRDGDARRKFADWDTFARCCDADLTMVRRAPDLVREAEAIMSRNGYRLGSGAGGASRRWVHTRGEVRTTSERPVKPPVKPGTLRSARTPRATAPKKPAPAPKPPAKPTHVECPNDPGMMVPLSGSCMCGWSPSDR
jgi:hypothetical protein